METCGINDAVYGQESPRWISLFKLVTFLLFKISRNPFFFVKLIGQWILDGKGRGIARDIKKKYFHLQNSKKKKITKLGQFIKPAPSYNFSFLNCPNFVPIFVKFWFFKLSLAIARPSASNLGQFKRLKCKEGSRLCKLLQCCYSLCRVLKM